MQRSISAVAPHHEKATSEQAGTTVPVTGVEHWTQKGDVRLFLWEKFINAPDNKPAVLFVHGSSMASQPTFDLRWTDAPTRRPWTGLRGAASCAGASTWKVTGVRIRTATHVRHRQRCRRPSRGDRIHQPHARHAANLIYGISSGRCARHCSHSGTESRGRLALDALSGRRGSTTLEQRRKKLPEFLKTKRRPIDRAFVYSIFERDHPECAERRVVDAFADAILALDSSMPNGTYIDMCSKLPVVDPTAITAPTIIMRGEFDGIAGFDDLMNFFADAESRQAVHRHARNFARQFSAKKLLARLSHPAFVL